MMKKKVLSLLLVLVLALPAAALFTGCTPEEPELYVMPENTDPEFDFTGKKSFVREDENPEMNETFLLAEENDEYELYFNESSLGICLVSKKTGEQWFSNPTPSQCNAGLPEMRTQLSMFYLNKETSARTALDSFTNCIAEVKDDPDAPKQFYVVNHEGHLRVIYIIGRNRKNYMIPTCLTETQEKAIEERLKAKRETVKGDDSAPITSIDYTQALSWLGKGSAFSKLTPDDWNSYTDEIRQGYLDIAPVLNDYFDRGETIYILKSEQFIQNTKNLALFEKIMASIDMTQEEKEAYDEEFQIVVKAPQNFWIPLDYKLTENGLNVSIAHDEIAYDENAFAIANLSVLQYFGSASKEEQGYMFLPDGSGALMNFNNGKTNIGSAIRLQVYGLDDGHDRMTQPFANEHTSLPVFGVKKDNGAMFAIIEGGDAAATIVADIAGKSKVREDRNVCYANFKIVDYEDLSFSSAGKLSRVYQPEKNSDDISINYVLLEEDQASYSGMAKYYRDYLIKKGTLKQQSELKEIPFNVEIVGAYDHPTAFLGIKYTEMHALTTFDQCRELITTLADKGIKNISLNYRGWANNGLRNTVFNKIKVLSALGGKTGLKDLQAFAAEKGVKLYFEAELAYVYDSAAFDGYSQLSDASRMITRDIAHHYQYFQDWQMNSNENEATIVSPSQIFNIKADSQEDSNVVRVMNDLKELGATGISLGSIGTDLTGNYKIKDYFDRAMTADVYAAAAEKLSSELSVMAKGTNAFMLPYVDSIFEISNTSSRFHLADESVPFYQMVIHGCIPYSGEPINLNGDAQTTMLQAVEAGAGLYYRWCYARNDQVQDLWFDGMYSLSYESWVDEAADMYKKYNDLLGDVSGCLMVDHEIVAKDIRKVTYDNGVSVYVNYTSADFTAEDGTLVPAMSFVRGGK